MDTELMRVEIARLAFKPGDVAVLRVDRPLQARQLLRLYEQVNVLLPPGVRCMVLDSTMAMGLGPTDDDRAAVAEYLTPDVSRKFSGFVVALAALCREHGVRLSTSGYDGLEAWDADASGKPLHAAGVEDCTKGGQSKAGEGGPC